MKITVKSALLISLKFDVLFTCYVFLRFLILKCFHLLCLFSSKKSFYYDFFKKNKKYL